MSRFLLISWTLLGGCLPDFVFTPPGTDGFDFDNDGFPAEGDCDDEDSTVFPGAPELCDGRRNDCDDGTDVPADESDPDGDKFVSCDPWEGGDELSGGDCAPDDDTVHPGATDAEADGLDADCDGYELCYADVDQDGYRTDDLVESPDTQCSKASQLALADALDDCNDGSPEEHEGVSWYEDGDGDGFGDENGTPVDGCRDANHTVEDHTDCDDGNGAINPTSKWYEDFDGDTFGDPDTEVGQCEPPDSEGWVLDGTDCDDLHIEWYPGVFVYSDCDLDGYFRPDALDACAWAAGDFCDLGNLESYTSSFSGDLEDCDDSKDKVHPDMTWYVDCDEDGSYEKRTHQQCTAPLCEKKNGDLVEADASQYTSQKGEPDDCDDSDDTLHADTEWYVDCDGDGYYAAETEVGCEEPDPCEPDEEDAQFANTTESTETDCDDHDADLHPGLELWIDCDGDGEYAEDPVDVCVIEVDCPTAVTSDDDPGGEVDCQDDDVDRNSQTHWYPDCDSDDAYSDKNGVQSCEEPTGTAAAVCFGSIAPTAPWSPNSYEPVDCDDEDEEAQGEARWYFDCDLDGYPGPSSYLGCIAPVGEPLCSDGAVPNLNPEESVGESDCDDEDVDEHPNQFWYPDCDGDGYFDEGGIPSCERPDLPGDDDPCGDGSSPDLAVLPSPSPSDCDDNDDLSIPHEYWGDCDGDGLYAEAPYYTCPEDGPPPCNAIDAEPSEFDCDDGVTDGQAVGGWYYADCDADGDFGPDMEWLCDPADPDDWGVCGGELANSFTQDANLATDCDDSDSDLYTQDWYADCDGDGYENAVGPTESCGPPASGYPCENGAGPAAWWHAPNAVDCDDNDVAVGETCVGGDGVGLSGDVDVTNYEGVEAENNLLFLASAAGDGPLGALAIIPDADADGDDEILLGMPGFNANGMADEGAVYLLQGQARPGVLDANLAWNPIPGGYPNLRFGSSLLGTGDLVGNDNIADVAVGATDVGTNQQAQSPRGAVYVFALGGSMPTSATQRDVQVTGVVDDGYLGTSMAAGDLSGDSKNDLVAGAPGANRAYLFLGPLDEHDHILSDPSAGVLFTTWADLSFSSEAAAGSSLAVLDFDHDGDQDLAIGDPDADADEGLVYVHRNVQTLLGTPGVTVSHAGASDSFQGTGAGSRLGASLCSLGDQNGDGYDDLLMGAPGYTTNGGAFLVPGQLGGHGATDPTNFVMLPGSNAAAAGTAVAAAGDTDGDGTPEFWVGEADGDSSAWLVQPSDLGAHVIELSTISAEVIARIHGASGSGFGSVLAGNGDMDGDGFPDALLGAPEHPEYGAAFGLFGAP